MKEKFLFYKENWKLGFHLLFRTKRFGVNNKWFYGDRGTCSYFGWSHWKRFFAILRVKPIIQNYWGMVFRMSIGFIPGDQFEKFYGPSFRKRCTRNFNRIFNKSK
jgi:hypothetical protein